MFRYSARALSQQNLDLSPNEVRSYLADIFRVQPSCISRQQYHLSAEKLSEDELKALNVCPPAIMLWGPPGIGKSEVVREAVSDAEIPIENFADIRLSTLEPVDLRGVPSVQNGRTLYNPPEFFPIGENEIDDILKQYNVNTAEDAKNVILKRYGVNTLEEAKIKAAREKIEQTIIDKLQKAISQEKGVILFDELPSAQRDMQIAAYEIILDRRIGKYTLPIGWSIVAAGNRPSEVAGQGASYLPIPLSNRMIHLSVKSSPEDWQIWAVSHGFGPEVVAFGYQELGNKDATKQERGYGPGETVETGVPAFLTPRSLEWLDFIDKQINSGVIDELKINANAKNEDTDNEKGRVAKALYRGAIGLDEATKYIYFKSTASYLLNGPEIYDHPDIADEYFKTINKNELSSEDIEKLGELKAMASGQNVNEMKNLFKANFKDVYENYYKLAALTRAYYPSLLLVEEYAKRVDNGRASKDSFEKAANAIINNLGGQQRAMLGILQGLGYKLSQASKNIQLINSAVIWKNVIDKARKKK